MYIPPFKLDSESVNLIAEISAKIERFVIRMEQADGLHLRKANKIRTIHSSLAIEGNTLSEGEVRDIIDGKNIIAPIKQIQEVKNAIAAYDLYHQLDPFDIKDLLKSHGIMMKALIDDAGCFRRGGVGVFSEKGLIHMAPPAANVPGLMKDLFFWLKHSEDHLLIRSCVFHYEFEFIHPFSDGNGRMGRLWQSLILGKLNPIFEHLPVENMVFSNQEKYYDAIEASSQAGESGPFINFMLREILETLKQHQYSESQTESQDINQSFNETFGSEFGIKFGIKFGINEKRALLIINSTPDTTINIIAEKIGISLRGAEKIIQKLTSAGVIERMGSRKSGTWKINKKPKKAVKLSI